MITETERKMLKPNHAGCFILKEVTEGADGAVSYGSIRIEDDVLVYWDYKKLKTILIERPDYVNVINVINSLYPQGEAALIESGFIKKISLSQIFRVVF
jgi:hypothetical protein